MSALSRIEKLCREKGLKLTKQRRVIARVLAESDDHPDALALFRRASRIDRGISQATVYRTVRLFEETGILERRDFGAGPTRYEEAAVEHHDHLIDQDTGEIIEFHNEEIERLQEEVARRHGFKLVGHRMELYGVRLKKSRTERNSED